VVPYCAFAPEAVRTLRAHGYAAKHVRDGLPEWAAAGNEESRPEGQARRSDL